MYKGTIIENSLTDISILNDLNVYKSWEAGSWKLHKVTVSKKDIKK